MRIGVLGAGRMGALRAQLLANSDHVTQVLLGNRDIERAVAAATHPKISPMSIEDVFRNEPEAYVVAVATAAHAAVLERCIEAGRPVLCEKPISDDLAESVRLVALAQERACEIQVGFMRRSDPGFKAAHDAVEIGSVGTVYCLRIISHDHEVASDEFMATSGGIFKDLMVHDFDMVRWLTGQELQVVYGSAAIRAHSKFAKYGDFDTCAVHAQLTDGALVTMNGCRHNPCGYDFRLEILGSRDSIGVGLSQRTPLKTPDEPEIFSGPPYQGFLDRFATAFRLEVDSFVRLVGGEGPNVAPAESAIEALRAAIASEISVRERRPVLISEVGLAVR